VSHDASRHEQAGKLRILRSPVIPEERFLHGFPERAGGVSEGPRTSLNLGFRWGDDPWRVEENRRRVAAAAGYDPEALVVTKHVHGTRVWRFGEPLPEPPEFDGLVADRPGVVLGAFAADCIPIVFADPDTGVCGAAHAGWRGTVSGVAREVVARMRELGSRPQSIRAALGPSIGPCCFEVGDEVVAAFREAFPEAAASAALVVPGPRKAHIDLRVAMRAQLEAEGLLPEHLDADPPCTRCNPERFFSYRRDGQDGGVHMGFIGCRS
jgi:polyphenol oxidase